MINILFGGNYKVYDGILLCLMSMTKHTNEELNIYILSAELTEINPEYRPISENTETAAIAESPLSDAF